MMAKYFADPAVVIGGSIAGWRRRECSLITFTKSWRSSATPSATLRGAAVAPQASHAHGLLVAASASCRAFSGFHRRSEGGGACVGRVGRDLVSDLANGRSYHGAFFQPEPRDLGVDINCQSRTPLEGTLRRRLEACAGVEGVNRRRRGRARDERTRSAAVRVEDGGGEATLAADLVLDASGRGSRALGRCATSALAAPRVRHPL